MHCERCQKEAAKVFLTQMVGEKLQKVDLCEKCARELGVTSNEPFSLADLLLKSSSAEPLVPCDPADQAACPQCGCTLPEVRKTGRLGCGRCYETFRVYIDEAVQTVQKGPRHRGKCPEGEIHRRNEGTRVELEQALFVAIRSEDYEQAARLRDQLREFESAV
jgi:protein arginine kinase activator